MEDVQRNLAALRIQSRWQTRKVRLYTDKLNDSLKCIICQDVSASIFRCSQSHIVCSECLIDMVHHHHLECPMCRSTQGYVRDRIIPSIASTLNTTLRCSTCCDLLPFSRYDEHKKICGVSMVACPIVDCNFKGTVEQLAEHVVCHETRYNTLVVNATSGSNSVFLALTEPTHLILVTKQPPRILSFHFMPRGSIHHSHVSCCDVTCQSMPECRLQLHLMDCNHLRVESYDACVYSRSTMFARCNARCEGGIIEHSIVTNRTGTIEEFFRAHLMPYNPSHLSPTIFHRKHDHVRMLYAFELCIL